MIIIQDEKKTDSTIIVDGKHFVGCTYTNCALYYGGEDYNITKTDFINCQINFGGPAARTAKFIQQFGIKFDPPQVQPSEVTQMKKRKAQ